MLEVGLTGGIASGKSTISRIFAALGCLTIDADAIVARLYRPGAAGYEALVREYGHDVLLPDGEIDRRKVADLAFANRPAALRLNEMIHPLVIEEERRMVDAEAKRFPGRDRIAIVEATLLIEAGGRQRYDDIVVVDVTPEVQIERAVARGMAREDVVRRIANQMPREERLRYADYVIDNSGSARDAELRTHEVYQSLVRDLERKKIRKQKPETRT